MNLTDLTERYAQALVQRDHFIARQQPVPGVLANEIEAIEAQARATLSPGQLAHAHNHATLRAAEIREHNERADALGREALAQREIARLLRQTTAGMTTGPLESTEQLKDIADGKAVTLKTGRVAHDQEAFEKMARDKFGVDVDTHLERLDSVVGAMDNGREASARKMMDAWKITDHMLDSYRNGDVLQFGLDRREAERQDAAGTPHEVEHTPTADDERRADLLFAIASTGGDELLAPDTTTAYDDDPGRAGDIARAWQEVDRREAIEELIPDGNDT